MRKSLELPEISIISKQQEQLVNPNQIKFDDKVPNVIKKLLEELFDKIKKYKIEVKCCYLMMSKELKNMSEFDLIHQTNKNPSNKNSCEL